MIQPVSGAGGDAALGGILWGVGVLSQLCFPSLQPLCGFITFLTSQQ